MSTNVAIIDDHDPLIVYSGPWITQGSSEEFKDTTSVSVTVGASASFTFVGTSITAYGTVAAVNPPNASMSFVVDGSIKGSYIPANGMSADIHHTALWESPALSDGSHTLVITQTAAQVAPVIFLDYFEYNTTATAVSAYFIDDRDSRITYTPLWSFFGSDGDFQHTSQGSNAMGDSFSLAFEGKAVSFYGGITDLTMKALMSLDGGPPVVFAPTSAPPSLTNNLIFSSGDLADGNHTLVVTSASNATMWVDYFLIVPSTLLPTTSAPSPSQTVSGSPSASTVSPSSISDSSPPLAPKKSTPVGAIVGAVVGVAVLLALAAAIIVCFRRRARRRDAAGPTMAQNTSMHTPIADLYDVGYGRGPLPGPTPVAEAGPSTFSNAGFFTAAAAASLSGPSHGHPYPVPSENMSTPASTSTSRLESPPSPIASAGPSPFPSVGVPLATLSGPYPAPSGSEGSTSGSSSARPLRVPAVNPMPRKLVEELQRQNESARSSAGEGHGPLNVDELSSPGGGGGEAPPVYSA
ncbi:hypothetical protein B0H11DRAFT_2129449 [Mycena galericulata]|nr:hypothetical protein B0H11DRAFT_2129449 [Mycena galericulata]